MAEIELNNHLMPYLEIVKIDDFPQDFIVNHWKGVPIQSAVFKESTIYKEQQIICFAIGGVLRMTFDVESIFDTLEIELEQEISQIHRENLNRSRGCDSMERYLHIFHSE